MLLHFSAENFRSLREGHTLDLRATAAGELRSVVQAPAGLEAGSPGVLPVAAVFGANASGKSSLFMAADFMRDAVLRSAESVVAGAGILERVTPFAFDPERRGGPVTLAVHFTLHGVRHEYGFTLQPRREAHSITRVVSEWLRAWPRGRQRDVFLRGEVARGAGPGATLQVSESGFDGGERLAKDLFEQTGEDVLFLSVASQRRQPQATAVVRWFHHDFCTAASPRVSTEALALHDPAFLDHLGRLLRSADTGIDRVEIRVDPAPVEALRRMMVRYGLPPERADDGPSSYVTEMIHRDDAGQEVALDLHHESEGTKRLFQLAGPIHAALQHGRCLWIDELDTAMHHWLLRALIKLFQRPESNPRGAQLLFTTHDAAVMDPSLLRRDQIWIVEKDAAQGSQLYSLVDVDDKPRKNQPLYKSFLSGRFGGVPRLDEGAILEWPLGEQ